MFATREEISQYLSNEFASDLAKLNSIKRPKSIKTLWDYHWLVGLLIQIVMYLTVPVVMFLVYYVGNRIGGDFGVGVSIVLAFILFFVWIYWLNRNQNKRAEVLEAIETLKEKIINGLFAYVRQSFTFQEDSHISLKTIKKSQLFKSKKYEISGDSKLTGTYKKVDFQFSNLYLEHRTLVDGEERMNEVFDGVFMVFSFHKKLQYQTFIMPSQDVIDNLLNVYQYLDSSNYGEKVVLEDPEFNNFFKVYSTNQLEARYILTPSFMQRIKDFKQKYDGELFISFLDNTMYMGNNNGLYTFDIEEKADYKAEILEYYDNVLNLIEFIDELNLIQTI